MSKQANIIEIKRLKSYMGITQPTEWVVFNPPNNRLAKVNPGSFGTWVYKINGVVYTEYTKAFRIAVEKVRNYWSIK